MVKINRETIESLKTQWDKPLKCEEDNVEAEPSPKRARHGNNFPVVTPQPERATSLRTSGNEAEKKNGGAKVIKNDGTVLDPPPEGVTGVEPHIVGLCAGLSQQIYDAYTKDYFQFEASGSKTVEVNLLDTHGDLNPAIPAFAVARAGDTLIMGWRGTNQVMDFITDVAIAPVHCSELGTAAGGIRCHPMFSSFVASDLKVHQDEIIEFIHEGDGKGNKIKRIVFTGHSLGGALASVAHLFFQAQIGGYNASSPWAALKNLNLELHTITFAAPMSVVDKDEVNKGKDNPADKLLKDVGTRTFNFVFTFDVVPRAYGHIGYIYDVLNTAGPSLVRSKIYLPWFSGKVSHAIVGFMINLIKPLIPVAVQFRHVGELIYYPEADSDTYLRLTDTGPAPAQKETDTDNGPASPAQTETDEKHFNHYVFGSYSIKKGQSVEELLEAHSYFPRAFAAYISVPQKKDD